MGRLLTVLAVALAPVWLLLPSPTVAAARSGCARASASGGHWPRYSYDPANSRWQRRETRITPRTVRRLRVAWSFSVRKARGTGAVSGTPLVVRGCVYAATSGGFVFALNADTGRLVWRARLGNRVSSLALSRGRLFANVARWRRPRTVALNARTGRRLWSTITAGPGIPVCRDYASNACPAEASGSPAVIGDMVMTSVSGWSPEQRVQDWYIPGAFRGSILWLDQVTGRIRKRTYTVSDEDWARGLSGAGVWSTAAVDSRAGYAFVGTGNPSSTPEPPLSVALVKIDIDPRRPTFGEIVASYRGDPGWDLDFGASPNLFRLGGRLVVGALQKAGSYHLLDGRTMQRVWRAGELAKPNWAGNAGTSATDGRTIYVPTGTKPFAVHALDARTGRLRWRTRTPSQGIYGPVTLAGGVAYKADVGRLLALDARTGKRLLSRSMRRDVDGAGGTTEGGASVARNTVYVPAGQVLVAYRLPRRPVRFTG